MGRTALFNRTQPGGVFTISDLVAHPGDIWFVDSGVGVNGAGYGQNPDAPCATLDYAVCLCTANNGDVIYVMPGHAETIVADSGVDIDVAGVKVIGLGWGADRPTFTFTTAVTADFKLAAASVHVENILFLGGIDATTGVVEISGADCKLINCEYRDVTGEATDIIVTVNNADRLLIDGLRVIGAAGDGGDTAIALDGCDDAVIRNFDIYGNFDLGAIECRTTLSARIKVHDGTIWTEGAEDLCIAATIANCTGTIGPNLNLVLQDNAANITEAITGATFQLVGPIWVVNAVAEQSMQINWTASTD
jgi:hypothetical protein